MARLYHLSATLVLLFVSKCVRTVVCSPRILDPRTILVREYSFVIDIIYFHPSFSDLIVFFHCIARPVLPLAIAPLQPQGNNASRDVLPAGQGANAATSQGTKNAVLPTNNNDALQGEIAGQGAGRGNNAVRGAGRDSNAASLRGYNAGRQGGVVTPPGRGGIGGPRQRPANLRAGVLAAANIQPQNIGSQAAGAGNGREVTLIDTTEATPMHRSRAIDQVDLLTDMRLF